MKTKMSHCGQVEEEAGRMELARRQLEDEVIRLQVSIREKDKDLQVIFGYRVHRLCKRFAVKSA